VVFYTVAVLWRWIAYRVLVPRSASDAARFPRPSLPLAIPVIAFVVMFTARAMQGHAANAGALTTDYGRILLGYVVGAYVAQFAWALLVFPLAWLARSVGGWLRRPHRWQGPNPNPAYVFILGVFLTSMLAVWWFPTYANDRYLLPFMPLFAIVSYGAMASLIRTPRIRWAILASWFVLFLASNSATLDPVSKLIYGTFPFGDHEMLDKTSITGECCGYGRDQLVYNAQFTALHDLNNAIFATLRPTDDTVLLADPAADWYMVDRLDPQSYTRTLGAHGFRQVSLASVDEPPAAAATARTYFIAYPNFAPDPTIGERYDVLQTTRFERLGYVVDVLEVRPKVVARDAASGTGAP